MACTHCGERPRYLSKGVLIVYLCPSYDLFPVCFLLFHVTLYLLVFFGGGAPSSTFFCVLFPLFSV